MTAHKGGGAKPPPHVPVAKGKKQPIPPIGPADDLKGGARPVIMGAQDSVMGAPLTPPTGKPLPKAGSSDIHTAKDDKHFEALALGTDSAGGYVVPKQLDGSKPNKVPKTAKRPRT